MDKLTKTLLIQLLVDYLTRDWSTDYTYEGFNNENRQLSTFEGLVQDTSIDIYAFPKINQEKRVRILSVHLLDDSQQIHISNIIVPTLLQHKGVGKKLIRLLYEIGQWYGYHTFVVDLTEGFRNRLLHRGALETNIYDVLQIAASTKLI